MTDEIRAATRAAIQAKGESQAAFARTLGMRPQEVSRALQGDQGKVPPVWEKMLDALGLKLAVVPKDEA